MAAGANPPEISPQRRALAAALRSLREAARLDQRELARRAGWTQPKVSRLENGRTSPTSDDLAAWVQAVGAGAGALAELSALAEQAAIEATGWKMLHRHGYGRNQQAVEELERESKLVTNFEPSIVPGLLQTAEYARRAILTWDPKIGVDDVADYVSGRLQRQQALYDPSQSWEFIVTEGALRWQPGPPEVLRAQLGHLRSMATLGNVKLGIIPFAGEAPAGFMHGFVVFERDEDTIITVETFTDRLRVEAPSRIDSYLEVLQRLRAGALWGDDAIAFLDTMVTEYYLPLKKDVRL
jgi:transcriptional regulator with XRE-family HTH domain